MLPYTKPHLSFDGQFVAGANFSTVVRLHDADRRLKLHVLDAIERVEIALRVMIGFTLGQRGAYAHQLSNLQATHNRIYSTLCVLAFLLQQIGRGEWVSQVRELVEQEIPACGRGLSELGFPAGWEGCWPWR